MDSSVMKVPNNDLEGKDVLDKRQKIIKIADVHGWDTVMAYDKNSLADDSDDDKWLSKAVRDADYKRREKDRLKKDYMLLKFCSFILKIFCQ